MSSPQKIMALDLPLIHPLPESTKKYFDICQEKLGMIPNVLKAYALDISKLEAFTGFYNELMLSDSGLTKLEREMIAVTVSSINKCFYCLVAHGANLRHLSKDPILTERIATNYKEANLNQRQRAMLEFAEKVTLDSSNIEESDRNALREAGFTDHEIWDLTNVAGFFNMTNRVASAVDMRPNDEYFQKNF